MLKIVSQQVSSPGSSFVIPEAALLMASSSSSATGMARSLLVSLFDMKTLLVSNLKGGCSRRPGSDDAVRLQKLDEARLNAIYS